MKFLSPQNRIALGLTGGVMLVICIARMLGQIPDKDALTVKSRAQLTESVALSGSTILLTGGGDGMALYLRGMVERNEDLLTAGVRDMDNELIIEIDNHKESWDLESDEMSSHSQMHVPLFESQSTQWGTIELAFTPLRQPGFFGLLQSMGFELMVFAASTSFLLFSFILGLVLKQLDPSQAAPQRVRDALNNLAEGLMILDTKENIVLANESLAEVVGKPAEELAGKKSKSINFEYEGDSPWQIAFEEKRLVSNRRVKLNQDGTEKVFMANCSPLLGNQGNFCAVMVTFDDVTQLEESRIQLREAKDAADAANEAKSSFLANMSHEIRTPMNAILGFTDVLRRGMEENPEQRIDYLNTIHSSGNHLIELINDILDCPKSRRASWKSRSANSNCHRCYTKRLT